MRVFGLLVVLLAGLAQQGRPSPEEMERMRQQAEAARRQYEQQAMHLNEIAGNIRSEADARSLVDAIAEVFAKELPPAWMTSGVRARVAHAEYQAVSSAGGLIPEQRVADVWNQYVRDIGASNEALVTAAEIHHLRDSFQSTSVRMWERGWNRSIWTMPSIYALGSDGKVAPGCRGLEVLRILHDLDSIFGNLRTTRLQMQKGFVVSDELKKREEAEKPSLDGGGKVSARLEARAAVDENPVRAAEYRYIKEHGELAMNGLVLQLFNELFPE